MNANNLLLQNWQLTASGGVDIAELKKRLTEGQRECVAEWFRQAQQRALIDEPLPSLKRCIDIASWCRFGTDSLTDFSREMRVEEIERASQRFEVSSKVLKYLITSTLVLEKCLGDNI